MMPDHVHMMITIPPKYSVAQVVGFIKGKSAIHIADNTWAGSVILLGRVFGQEAVSYPRLVETKKLFENIYATRKLKTVESINCNWYSPF